MSHRQGRGGRRHYRDDMDDRVGREAYDTPEKRLHNLIIRFGAADPDQEAPKLAAELRSLNARTPSVATIAEGFRISVTEQPYKIPHYAAVIRSLDSSQEQEDEGETSLRKPVLEDFWKGFQSYLDKLAWREVRLCVHLFAHLTSAQVISSSSFLSLLQSFTAVLDEFGVSHSRAKHATRCAAEGLMRAGAELKTNHPAEVTEIIHSIESYAETVTASKLLASPMVKLHAESVDFDNVSEVLDCAIKVLKELDASDFVNASKNFPELHLDVDSKGSPQFFDLPNVLVPPEAIDIENLGSGSEAATVTTKNEDWPEYRISLFDNDVTTDPSSALGYTINSLISDVIDIFEVNRKECARLLLELPKWSPRGTFKARPGVPAEDGDGVFDGPAWQLESCVMENIIAKLLVLPRSQHASIYYIALITELCKLQPSTTGPALGKSIRKLYVYLADGLDVEAGRRFVEWFATHMSNFGFSWVWKEWIPDLSLTTRHPKRNFIRRAIEIEIRLAYHERVQKTLPEVYHDPEAGALADQAPGPEFDYEDPRNPFHDTAEQLLNLLRGRSKAEEVVEHLDTLKAQIQDAAEGEVNIDSVARAITIQSLLHIGSRSFSHFLNAIERYLPVLRVLATGTEEKKELLQAAESFWRRNPIMVRIVFDKLMQYQIVDPSDVIAWAFLPSPDPAAGGAVRIDTFRWEIVEAALDKANGRVVVAKKKVEAMRKEQDDNRARETAGGNMEVDADAAMEDKQIEDSPALTTALKAYSTLSSEQRSVLSKALCEFVNCLSNAESVITETAWFNRANWSNEEWDAWETWGWYRNFCRLYAPYLRESSITLGTIAFAKIEGSTDDATLLLKRVWNVSTSQEA